MAIAGCYTMDLYCDCEDCAKDVNAAYSEAHHHLNGTQCGFEQYFGETFQEAAGYAKKKGWYISRDRSKCFAPGHPHRLPKSGE